MKQFIVVLFFGLLLTGCGTKKRVARSDGETGTRQQPPTAQNDTEEKGSYPLPEDSGKFIKFPIGSIEDYIETFSEMAQFEMKAYGIPASITLAQGILESGFGQGELTLKTNNHFGIKCHTDWEGQYDHHDDDEKGECFRKYNHPMYSFRDHSIFLSSRARYAPLFTLRRDDYKGWARGLKAAGYATDKRYPQKLIAFIERHQLHRFDLQVLNEGYPVRKYPSAYDYTVHVVQKGDTLYSLSRKYFVSVNEIMKLNSMDNSRLSIGQELKIKTERINR
ncbi:MAG TPA: glucosaminidase domain-containing protein [Eudoraea sp.]|nr:glucosaminidase domain-containing protein [Eudoraea sp.]